MLAANSIDHHARDRVDAVVAAAALRTSARDEEETSGPGAGLRPLRLQFRSSARARTARSQIIQSERVLTAGGDARVSS
jgi:hypothetical protein